MATTYDLLLRGGQVIDPAQKLNGRYDVAFAGGRVAAVGEHLAPEEEASGLRRRRVRSAAVTKRAPCSDRELRR